MGMLAHTHLAANKDKTNVKDETAGDHASLPYKLSLGGASSA